MRGVIGGQAYRTMIVRRRFESVHSDGGRYMIRALLWVQPSRTTLVYDIMGGPSVYVPPDRFFVFGRPSALPIDDFRFSPTPPMRNAQCSNLAHVYHIGSGPLGTLHTSS